MVRPLNSVSFFLKPTPPFRLDLTVWALRRRPHNRMDRWDGRVYRQLLTLDGQPLAVAVTQTAAAAPRLRVTLTGPAVPANARSVVAETLTRTLGLHRDLTDFYAMAATDRQLGPLVERFRGLKPPRFLSVFDCLVNAITCQQITLSLGLHLLNRLAEAHGPSIADGEDDSTVALPRPETLVTITPETFRAMQFSRQKARALIELSAAVRDGTLNLEELEGEPNDVVTERLRQLWGVGRWTAEYALLRGLGRLDTFPADDAGAVGGLRRWLDLPEKLDYDGVHEAVRRWQPYAGLVYFHLLLNGLDRGGHLS